MNTRLLPLLVALVSALPLSAGSAPFTYQGVLTDSGRLAQSSYDLRFRIYAVETGGAALAEPVYTQNLLIHSGHFLATLDFGNGIFNGQSRWLEIAVRPAGSLADHTTLVPRQLITAAPYAITAEDFAGANPAYLNDIGSSNIFNGTIQSPLRVQGDSSQQVGEIRVAGGEVAFSTDDSSSDHHGMRLLLQAGNGMGPDKNGGNILLLPGDATGEGRAGRVVIDGSVKVTGSVAATALFADGSGIINLSASNLTGVLGNQQLAGSYANAVQLINPANQFQGTFRGDGNALSNLTASAFVGVVASGGLMGTYASALDLINPANRINGAFSGTFAGDGNSLSNVTASAFTGILPNAGLSGTYAQVVNFPNASNSVFGSFFGDGSALSNLQASRITGALSSQHLAGSYDNVVRFASPSNQFAGAFQGDGTGLTVSASRLLGTLPEGALSGTYGLTLNLINPANSLHGAFTGNGIGLSNVNASKLEGLAREDFAQRHSSNFFSAGQTFAGTVLFSNAVSIESNLQVSGAIAAATLSGNGFGLQNLAASNLVGVLGSAQLQGAYANTVQFTSVANQFNGAFNGSGAGLANLNASALTGLVPNTALSGTYGNALNLPNSGNTLQGTFTGDGSKLANIAASNLVGVLASARLQGIYSNALQFTNSANQFNGTFTGNGSSLSNLPAASLLGTLPNSLLSGSYNNALTLANPANSVRGSFIGDGAALSNISAAALTGTLPNNLLSGAYNNPLTLANAANTLHGSFIGDGSRLINLAASNLVGIVPDARLQGLYSSALQFNNSANQFSGTFRGDGTSLSNITAAALTGILPNTLLSGSYNNALALANPANTVHGSFTGDGGALNNLNGSALSTGTVPDARLSANVAMLNSSPVFNGSVTAQADLFASRLSAGTIGINTTNPVGRVLLVNGAAGITGTNVFEFGANVAGKHVNAGKIGYQTFTPGALDIVGAGTNLGSRRIKFWAESGATFNAAGTNPVVTLLNTVDEPTAFSLVAPYRTWRIGQNKPPDSPNIIDAFYIRDETANATRLTITDTGRVGLGTNNPAHPLHLANGAHCTAAGVWTSVSDRNAKDAFTPIEPREVLEKVAQLPVSQWKYKVEPAGVKHIGPTAQDFHAAFGLGESDTTIGAVDATGVALAAIKGLNEQLKQKEAEMASLREKNRALETRLNALERSVRVLAEALK